MKKFVISAALALVAFVALPNRAEAGIHISVGHSSNYVSGHASCGCPIYTRRVCYGHDRYHHPIYRYYRQPFHCGCRARQVSYQRGYNTHGYYSRNRGHSRHDSYRSSGHRSRNSYGSHRSSRGNSRCRH